MTDDSHMEKIDQKKLRKLVNMVIQVECYFRRLLDVINQLGKQSFDFQSHENATD